MSLRFLVDSRRVVVCAGPGGVGKTTIAASLALSAVAKGKRVLCLTIDPARRLANSLGIDTQATDFQRLQTERLAPLGLSPPGELWVMMLDTKSVFDRVLERHAGSEAARDRIHKNKLYRYFSTHLAGVQSYMAMEQVLAVKKDSRFDLIVLDTPPTTEALDFLQAPERLVEALDSPAMRWLVQAFEPRRTFSLNLLAKGAAFALRGMGRLTGKGFLESVAELVTDLSSLFGGFRARAEELRQSFLGPEFGYVLVTAPKESAILDAEYFAARLSEEGLGVDSVVVNRVHSYVAVHAEASEIESRLSDSGFPTPHELARKVEVAAMEARVRSEEEGRRVDELSGRLQRLKINPKAMMQVPAMERDVHDLEALAQVAKLLSD